MLQLRIVFLLAALIGLQACSNQSQPLIDEGARPLAVDEVEERLIGNTEFWSQGFIYYHPDGKLDIIWHKIKSKGSYTITEDGYVCLDVPNWKEENCHYYLESEGRILTVDRKRVRGFTRVEEGNQMPR